MTSPAQRFQFIAHALRGDGPFRPVVSGEAVGSTALVKYPRESDARFARRNEVAWFDVPLGEAASRFAGFLSSRTPVRRLGSELYQRVADDADGQGNAIDVFWHEFAVEASARGSMLLLVDMPGEVPPSVGQQVQARAVPYFTAIAPEAVTEYALGHDGRFDYVQFAGSYELPGGKVVPAVWVFNRMGWQVLDVEGEVLDAGDHPLGECPVLIFTERGAYPCFGRFAPIADLSRRLFNMHSELDEILRSQTFSLLTMQVPDTVTDEEKIAAARVAGQTIGTSNLMIHSGTTPAFIAPPEGPARVYLDRIKAMEHRIAELGLDVKGPNAQESGVALQQRFHALNAALATYAGRMEDLERRAWELARRWLGMTTAPEVSWPRDFSVADVVAELDVLRQMQDAGMPEEVVGEQMRRIVGIQFAGLEQGRQDAVMGAIDALGHERRAEPPGGGASD